MSILLRCGCTKMGRKASFSSTSTILSLVPLYVHGWPSAPSIAPWPPALTNSSQLFEFVTSTTIPYAERVAVGRVVLVLHEQVAPRERLLPGLALQEAVFEDRARFLVTPPVSEHRKRDRLGPKLREVLQLARRQVRVPIAGLLRLPPHC